MTNEIPAEVGISPEDAIRLENPGRIRIYDIRIDQYRFATQDDIDAMRDVCEAYGRMSQFWNENHSNLGVKLNWPGFQRGVASNGT